MLFLEKSLFSCMQKKMHQSWLHKKNPLAQSNLNKILIWNLTEPTLSVSTFTKIATSCLPWEQKITERKKFQWSSSVIKDYGACDYQMITTRASCLAFFSLLPSSYQRICQQPPASKNLQQLCKSYLPLIVVFTSMIFHRNWPQLQNLNKNI